MRFYKFSLYSFLLLLLLSACHDDNNDPEPTPPPAEPEPENPVIADAYTQRVNSFIYQAMKSCYLWTDQIPELDRQYETDPKAYFKKILTPDDRFSAITDDLQSLLSSTEGIEETFGYSLAYQWGDEAKTKIRAIVEYVYPNSPASLAGIQRGDLIVSLNGQNITQTNMDDLINSPNISIGVRKYRDGKYTDPETVALATAIVEQNPVHTHKIINARTTKVGYLFYSSYIGKFNSSLDSVFTAFKNAGISELILDLRYNLGGDEEAVINLCSHIAPAAVCQNKELIIQKEFNAIQTEYNRQDSIDANAYFTDSLLNDNLNLSRVFILTSNQTYSASEVTLVGLDPYMDVIRIGERTGGKYTGMQILPAVVYIGNFAFLDPIIGNWALYPIVLEYKNKNGENPKGGLAPDYNVSSFYLPMEPLGDEKDPLVARALELITGTVPATTQAYKRLNTQQPFRHKASVFDDIKKNFFVSKTAIQK